MFLQGDFRDGQKNLVSQRVSVRFLKKIFFSVSGDTNMRKNTYKMMVQNCCH